MSSHSSASESLTTTQNSLRERALRAKRESEEFDEAQRAEERAKQRHDSAAAVKEALQNYLNVTVDDDAVTFAGGDDTTAYAAVDGLKFFAFRGSGQRLRLRLDKPCPTKGCASGVGATVYNLASLGYALESDEVDGHEHYFPEREEATAEPVARAMTPGERLVSALRDFVREECGFTEEF